MRAPKLKARGRLVNALVIRRFVVQLEFAVAAIAAAATTLAQMVGAGVLCAMCAYARLFCVADTAGECRWCHFEVPFVFFGAAVRAGG